MPRLSLAAVLTLFVAATPAWSTSMDAASESPSPLSFERSASPDFVALDPLTDQHRTPGSLQISTLISGFFGEPTESAPGSAEIYAFREAALADMFGEDLGHEDLKNVVLETDTEVPMVMNSRVERHMRFLTRRPGHVRTILGRADTYFPMIEQVLREERVPDELKYMAVIESALKPSARSWAGAAGLWQFIPATGGAYGLTVNRDVDWRLDPERATRAAARHLRDLYDRFGDWHLAMAGYNMNPERVARYVRDFERRNRRTATYWDIIHRLPRETQGYVPTFIASALIYSNPEAYGFDRHRQGPAWRFDRIPVEGGTRFSEVARIVGTTRSVIQDLNPAFRQGRVPSGHLSEMIRVPSGTYRRYARQLDRLAPSRSIRGQVAQSVSFPARVHNPIAPEGRTSARIAARTTSNRPARDLLARMDGIEARNASNQSQGRTWGAPQQSPSDRPAREVLSQADDYTPPRAQSPSDRPSQELVNRIRRMEGNRYAPVERKRPILPDETQTPSERPARELVAELRGVPVEELIEKEPEASENPVKSADEQPRSGREALSIQLVADEGDAEVVEEEPEATLTHVVQRGEWLTQIGREYNVTVGQIMAWNGLRSETVHPGQRLTIHSDPAAAPARQEPATVVYTVQRGDNLTQIARRHGCSVHDLRRWNNLSRNRIVPGQRLTIHREQVDAGVIG